jgi:hypothetical protein
VNRRRLLLALAALTLLFIGGAAFLLLRSSSPISQAGCDRIERGMSEAEVNNIFGGPEGNYHNRQVDINPPVNPEPGLRRQEWIGNDGAAHRLVRPGG